VSGSLPSDPDPDSALVSTPIQLMAYSAQTLRRINTAWRAGVCVLGGYVVLIAAFVLIGERCTLHPSSPVDVRLSQAVVLSTVVLVVAQIVAIIWLGVASQSDGVLPALLCFGAVFSCCGPLPVALLIYGAVIRHALRGQGIRIGLFGICDADILVV
jgi:hypothetical protein